jgi:TonB family protein
LQPQQVPQKLIDAAKLLAPTVIPDKIPDVVDTPPIQPVPLPPDAFKNLTPASVGVDVGMAGGIEGGTGTPPPPPPPPPDDGRLHIKRGERVPNKAIRQEYPNYPEEARIRGYEDNVVVRYTIGKDGKVKDITVIDAPYRQMFADQVIHTLRGWKFSPYINENGEPEEVVHEVQFNFQLH